MRLSPAVYRSTYFTQYSDVIAVVLMVFISVLTLRSPIIQFGGLDPYFYTGLIHDYSQTLGRYGPTYYANRVAFNVPARLIIMAFGDEKGILVQRMLYLMAIGLACYTLGLRFYSRPVGLVVAAWATFNPWIIRSLAWDYVDGVAITYSLVGLCCFIVPRDRRTLYHVLGGTLFAFACNANAFTLAVAATFIPAWLVLNANRKFIVILKLSTSSLIGFIFGYLIVALIQYAEYPKLGLMREFNTWIFAIQLLGGVQSSWFRPISILTNSGIYYFFTPFALILICSTFFFKMRKSKIISLFAWVSQIYAFSLYALFVAFHYILHSGIYTYSFYLSYLTIPTILMITSLVGETFGQIHQRWTLPLALASVTSFAFMWVGFDFISPLMIGNSAFTLLSTAFAISLALLLATSPMIRAAVAVIGCMIAIAITYNENSGSSEYVRLHSRSAAALEKDAYRGALFLQNAVARTYPIQDGPVGFWYGARPEDQMFNSVQSIFLWGFSNIISPTLPNEAGDQIDAETRGKLTRYRHLVILSHEEHQADMAMRALSADGSLTRVRASFVYPGQLLSYRATFVDFLPAPAVVGSEIARLPVSLLTSENAGRLVPEGKAVRLQTDPHQWFYSASVALTSLNLPARPLILRVSATVSKGQISVMVVDHAFRSKIIAETPSAKFDGSQMIDVVVPDGSFPLDLVLRNSSTETSVADIDKITVYSAPSPRVE